jgi:hypothetical protein
MLKEKVDLPFTPLFRKEKHVWLPLCYKKNFQNERYHSYFLMITNAFQHEKMPFLSHHFSWRKSKSWLFVKKEILLQKKLSKCSFVGIKALFFYKRNVHRYKIPFKYTRKFLGVHYVPKSLVVYVDSNERLQIWRKIRKSTPHFKTYFETFGNSLKPMDGFLWELANVVWPY